MTKEQLLQMIEGYLKWLEQVEANLNTIKVATDMIGKNIQLAVNQLRALP